MTVAIDHLVREALDERWSSGAAAFRLRVLVGDDRVLLRQLRARLRCAAGRRESEPIRRALETVDVCLRAPEPANISGMAGDHDENAK
jgi:hypothetical protein